MIIAIDGEASTGKSTQAKKIAKRLNINYRDSGAYDLFVRSKIGYAISCSIHSRFFLGSIFRYNFGLGVISRRDSRDDVTKLVWHYDVTQRNERYDE